MNTKEIIVSADTEKAALTKLRDDFTVYRRRRGIKVWKWRKKPEAEQTLLLWRAYGRIEF